jgi:hypothetical protein
MIFHTASCLWEISDFRIERHVKLDLYLADMDDRYETV